MNSFSGVERALEVEFARQCALLEAGGTVEQQTMLWDGAQGRCGRRARRKAATTTATSRSPTCRRSCSRRSGSTRTARDLPELPAARRARFARGLRARRVRRRRAHRRSRASPTTTSRVARAHGDPKAAANWVMGEVLAHAQDARRRTSPRFRVRPARPRVAARPGARRRRSATPRRSRSSRTWWRPASRPRRSPSARGSCKVERRRAARGVARRGDRREPGGGRALSPPARRSCRECSSAP